MDLDKLHSLSEPHLSYLQNEGLVIQQVFIPLLIYATSGLDVLYTPVNKQNRRSFCPGQLALNSGRYSISTEINLKT